MFEIAKADADAFQWNVTGRRRNWNFCRQIEGISGKGSDTKGYLVISTGISDRFIEFLLDVDI